MYLFQITYLVSLNLGPDNHEKERIILIAERANISVTIMPLSRIAKKMPLEIKILFIMPFSILRNTCMLANYQTFSLRDT